jgi:hypothetical protein
LANLFMTVLDAFTPAVRAQIAAALEEPEANLQRAIEAANGSVVQALIAQNGPAGAAAVLDAVRASDPRLLADASPLLTGDWRDGEVARRVLGSRWGALADGVAARAGVKPASARALLNLSTPLVLAAIARSGVASDEAGLRSYLRTLEAEATRMAPPASPPPTAAEGLLSTAPETLLHAPDPSRPWLLWAILALLALAVLAWLLS